MTELAKGEKSFYHLYLATLPEKVDGLPSDFTKDELALLEGSPLLANIRKKIDNIRHDYELLVREVPELGRYTFEEFNYCRGLVSSRVFGIEIDGEKTGGMVPFAGRRESEQT